MANPAQETVVYPFTNFNFSIEITQVGSAAQLVSAAFAECDGLEMTMEVKTIREGGNNNQQIRLTGPLSFGTLTLKRGMTANFDLWEWVTKMQQYPMLRANVDIVLYAPNGTDVRARFKLARCLPIKLKAPALNAKDGTIAIEELQIAYESLTLEQKK
jgi:phage tail-like protein